MRKENAFKKDTYFLKQEKMICKEHTQLLHTTNCYSKLLWSGFIGPSVKKEVSFCCFSVASKFPSSPEILPTATILGNIFHQRKTKTSKNNLLVKYLSDIDNSRTRSIEYYNKVRNSIA